MAEENKGWKTVTTAISGMLLSLGAIAGGVASDPMQMPMIWGGVSGFIAALGLLGVGHKLQKLIDAINNK